MEATFVIVSSVAHDLDIRLICIRISNKGQITKQGRCTAENEVLIRLQGTEYICSIIDTVR